MFRMRHHGLMLLAVLPLGILLSGCGGTPKTPPTDGPRQPPIGVEPGNPGLPGRPSLPPINIHIDKPTIVINDPDGPTTSGSNTGTGSSTGTGTGSSTGSGSSTDTGTGSSTGTGTGSSTGSGSSTDTGTGSSTGTGTNTGTGAPELTPEQKAAQAQARIDLTTLEARLQQLVGKINPRVIAPAASRQDLLKKMEAMRNAVPNEIIALQDAYRKFLEDNDANAWAAAKNRASEFLRKNPLPSDSGGAPFRIEY